MNNRGQISWLDYIILNNPDGIVRILAGYGYPEPASLEDIRLYALDFISRHGDKATVQLLKAHPEYLVFKDILSSHNNFRNATGNFAQRFDSFLARSPLNQALVALGIFLLIYNISMALPQKQVS
jgi:hypothetical protein